MPKQVTSEMREEMRRQIIRVAAGEFSRLGYEPANINIIAQKAGIGKGSIYLYFNSKHELFTQMLSYIVEAQLQIICPLLQEPGRSPQEKLAAALQAFSQMAEHNPDFFRVFFTTLFGVNRAFKEDSVRLLQMYMRMLKDLLHEAHPEGTLPESSIEPQALLLLSILQTLPMLADILGYEQSFIQQQTTSLIELLAPCLTPTSA